MEQKVCEIFKSVYHDGERYVLIDTSNYQCIGFTEKAEALHTAIEWCHQHGYMIKDLERVPFELTQIFTKGEIKNVDSGRNKT